MRIARIIEGSDDLAAHGSRDMPTWGQVFHQMEGGGPATTKLRVANLTGYLKAFRRNEVIPYGSPSRLNS